MKKESLTGKEIVQKIEDYVDANTDGRTTALKGFAERMGKRAKRLKKAEERIKEELGDDHPEVIHLQGAAKRAEAARLQIGKTVARAEKIPKQKEYEWMVFGRVLDARGRPAAGLTVQVYDRDQKYDDLLGKATTDEDGDFQILYHEKAFAGKGEDSGKESGDKSGDKSLELYLMVLSKKGKTLFSSERELRYKTGRAEYFEVVLPDETKTSRKRR